MTAEKDVNPAQENAPETDAQASKTNSDAGEGQRLDPDKGQESDNLAPGDSPDNQDPLGFGDERMDGDSDELAAARAKAQATDDEAEELSEVDQLRAALEASEAKVAEHWDRLLRLQADMENQRKRAQNETSKARKFALEGIVGDLLPIKDSLELGLQAADGVEPDVKALREGSELTLKMLAQVFENNNILEINPVDEKFDPEFHQAMSMQEIEGKAPNTVAAVMQKGYTLNDRLVRPALVMVSK